MTVAEKERLRRAESEADRLASVNGALHRELELERARIQELQALVTISNDLITHYQSTTHA